MSESIGFALPGSPLQVRFDGPQLTSDGGLCRLAEVDAALGRCAALAGQVREWHRGSVRHALEQLVRQRVGCAAGARGARSTWPVPTPVSRSGSSSRPAQLARE
jgi:hypothetical protein